MTEGLQIALFAIATSLAFIVSLFSHERDWRLSVASTGTMLVFWAVNTATWLSGSFGVSSLLGDGLFATLALALFLARARGWAMVLAALYAADVAIDFAFARGRLGYSAMATSEDVIFLAQLVAASWPGWIAFARAHADAREMQARDEDPGAPSACATPTNL